MKESEDIHTKLNVYIFFRKFDTFYSVLLFLVISVFLCALDLVQPKIGTVKSTKILIPSGRKI